MSEMARGAFARYLSELGARIVDDEAAAAYERERAEWAADQRRRAIAIQVGHLSARHVAYVQVLEHGNQAPSDAWLGTIAELTANPQASVLLVGPTGLGKTTAATRWAYRRALAGSTVMHLAASRCDRIARSEEAREEAEQVDVLLVDELHRLQSLPGWIATALTGLLDARYQSQRQMIGLATCEPGDTAKLLGQEVIERLGKMITLTGASYRRTW